MSVGAVPGRYGACIVVSNSTELAALSPVGLTPGTQVRNAGVGAYFALTTSTAALVTDSVVEVLGVTGARWIIVDALSAANAAKLATVVDGNSVAQLFRSPTLDFTTLAATAVVVPALGAGYYFVPFVSQATFATKGATMTTAPIWKLGTNGARDNYGTGSTASTVNLNAVTAPARLSFGVVTVGTPILELTSALTAEITQAAAGGVLTGRITFLGAIVTSL